MLLSYQALNLVIQRISQILLSGDCPLKPQDEERRDFYAKAKCSNTVSIK